MLNNKVSRREFIKLLSLSGLSLGVNVFLGGCEPIFDAIANRPVRRNLASLSSTDPIVEAYKDAVSAMKSLPASDPRSWDAQAQIHLNYCPHGNWYFLPWHRAYLFYFEQICRELSGMEAFALPYWNWSANRQVPAVFWGGVSNPLFHTPRSVTETSMAADEFVGAVIMESILRETNFFLFASGSAVGQRDFSSYGRLEGTSHNYIHGFVGGTMSTFLSPLDPIFWTHHNMIDCCWVNWNITRNNPNTNDPQWTNFTFTGNFVDGSGASVDIDVLTTILMPLLSYRFEESAKGSAETEVAELDDEAVKAFLEAGADVQVTSVKEFELRRGIDVQLNQPLAETITVEPEIVRTVLENGMDLRLLLTVGDVDIPAGGDFFVRVFVNKPDATAETPIDDPHYAGSFAFFIDEQHAHQEDKPDYIVDLTTTVRGLGDVAERSEIDIQLVPVALPEREPSIQNFTLEFINLSISRVSTSDQ